MKKIIHYLFAFIIPVVIFLFAMYLMDLYPFGDTSMRVIDSISQYPAFFEGLKDGDLFTFKIGLGANFYTIWTTYLASPLSLLYLFFENYQFDIFFVILILLKIGLIGLNMNILLNYKQTPNKNSLLFSTIYALSGYVSLYYWNYQFLDALYMLPLIMIGIEKIVNRNENLMYFITLTLMIVFHYYTAYMICIFSVIYFFFLLINSGLDKKEKKKRIIKFFLTSLFCGLCSSFITIPSIYSFLQGRANVINGINYFGINKDVFSIFYNFTSGSINSNNLGNNMAPTYITLFIVVLIIYSFFDTKTTKQYKKTFFLIIIIYISSLLFNYFYYVWHFFSEPQGLPGRFVFCFNCFFVLIAYKTFLNQKYIKIVKSKIFILLCFFIFLSISFYCKIYVDGLTFKTIDSIYIILFILNLFLLFYYNFCLKIKKSFLITICLVVLEIIIHLLMSFHVLISYNGKSSYSELKDTYIKLNEIAENINKKANTFFRTEINGHYNAGLLFGYNGINYYSSLYNENVINFLENYKYSAATNYILMYKSNFYLNDFLGLENIIIPDENDFNLIKNEGINSLGLMVSNDYLYKNEESEWINNFNLFTNKKYSLNSDIVEANTILKNVIYNNGYYELINKDYDGFMKFTYDINDNYYINEDFSLSNIYINTETNYSVIANEIVDIFLNNKKAEYITELNKGDKVLINIKIPKKLKMISISYDKLELIKKNNYNKVINNLNENVITNLEFNSLGFIGNLTVNNGKNLLLITVPYDDNYEIFVNGKRNSYSKYLNGIIGLELDDGEYIISLKYRIKGLRMGIVISTISIFVFIFLKTLEKTYISSYNNSDNKEEIF